MIETTPDPSRHELPESLHELSPSRYSDEPLPLKSYATLLGLYQLSFVLFLLIARKTGRAIPERVSLGDILLIGVATFKLSRAVTKEAVTSVIRAPFSEFEEKSGEGELSEHPRGTGTQRAIGELLTCPFCMGTWIAAMLAYGLVLSPPVTRLIASIFAMKAVSDLANLAYSAATTATERLCEGE